MPDEHEGTFDRLKQRFQEEQIIETSPDKESDSRSYIFVLALIVGLILFVALALVASTIDYFPIDLTITQSLQTIDLRWFDVLMRAVSWPGRGIQSTILSATLVILIYWSGLRWEAVVAAITGSAVAILNLLLKAIVQRPRPSADIVDVIRELGTFSFPSGHVMYYTAFYGFLLYLSFCLLRRLWLQVILVVFFGGMILLVGPSRIYLGVHWPSDVLGAYIIGGLSLFVAIQIYLWGRDRFFTRADDHS